MCLDGDNAGRNAATRTALKALEILEPGKSLQFAFLPDGEDPDSLVQRDGLGAFRTVLAHPQSLEHVLWHHLSAGLDLQTADGRANADAKLATLLNDIKHPVVKQAYKAALRDKIYQASRGGAASAKTNRKTNPNAPMVPAAIQAPQTYQPEMQGDPTVRLLVAYICRWPQLLAAHDEALGALPLPPGPLAELVQHLLRSYVAGNIGASVAEAAHYADDLLIGPHASTVAELVRSTGVGLLADETDADAAFTATYQQWRARMASRSSQQADLKTNFLDPAAWAAFSQKQSAKRG